MDFGWEAIKPFAFIALLLILWAAMFGRKWLSQEISQNERAEPPSEQQLKWHLRHMREDMHTLVVINYVMLCVALYAIFFK